MANNARDIGKEIIIKRAAQGWTQEMLAKELNTTQRTVSAWESGESVPRNTMKVKLARVFGLDDSYFLENGFSVSDEDARDAKSESDKYKEELLMKMNDIFSDSKYDLSDEIRKELISNIRERIE